MALCIPWRNWKAATESGCSGCWRYVHVEDEGVGVGVVVLGIAFLGERDARQAFASGLFAAGVPPPLMCKAGTRLRQVKFAEIASLLAQFATANVSTTACEGFNTGKVATMSGCSATQFGGVPYVGALFDSSNGQPTTHFATAFVVAGKYGNMLMSAAHILNGRSASSIIFAPGYADGQAPHNLWHVHKAYTDSAWQANQGIDDDFCFLKVGADVQVRVGSLNLLTGVHPQTCNVIGYPDGLTSPVQATVQAVWYSPEHQLKFTCDGYPNGTSGSPWIINGNSAYGLLGGYQQGGDTPSVSYSPYFGANVRNLYDSANGAFL